jgi:hypothetical protein
MKLKTILLVAAALALLATGVWIGQAAAATGCFSDTIGHWAEQAICWAASNGVVGGFPDGTFKPNNTVTRAQVAVMLKNQANVPPEAGEILVSVSPASWFLIEDPIVDFPPSPTSFVYKASNSAVMRSTVTKLHQYVTSVSAPVAMYGRYTRLKGAKLCYTASSQAILAGVAIMKVGNENNGSGTPNASVVDSTPRTDENCRTYLLTIPPDNPNYNLLKSGEHVNATLSINFTNTGAYFRVSSMTFIFEPTTELSPASITGIAPPEDAQEAIMPLSEFPEWFGLFTDK